MAHASTENHCPKLNSYNCKVFQFTSTIVPTVWSLDQHHQRCLVLIRKANLGPHPIPTEWETLGLGPSNLYLAGRCSLLDDSGAEREVIQVYSCFPTFCNSRLHTLAQSACEVDQMGIFSSNCHFIVERINIHWKQLQNNKQSTK